MGGGVELLDEIESEYKRNKLKEAKENFPDHGLRVLWLQGGAYKQLQIYYKTRKKGEKE